MKTVKVRVTATQTIQRRYSVDFCGVKIAVAFGRDSGAKVGYNARLVSGEIGSGGSAKNWYCYVNEGAIFETEVSEEHLLKFGSRIKTFNYEIINEFSKSKESSDLDEKILKELNA